VTGWDAEYPTPLDDNTKTSNVYVPGTRLAVNSAKYEAVDPDARFVIVVPPTT